MPIKPSYRSKGNAKKPIISTKTGIKVRSRLEQRVADDLTARGIKYLYEKEKLKYTVPASEHVYTPDLTFKSRKWICEIKGVLDFETQKKMLHVRASNPDRDIRFLFQRDNVIRRGSKTRYSDWCNKHGFLYAIGKIPQEWLDE